MVGVGTVVGLAVVEMAALGVSRGRGGRIGSLGVSSTHAMRTG